MIQNNLLTLLHYLVIFFIISIPFHPMKILKYTYSFPLLLPILWLIFDDCPLTLADNKINNNKEVFTQELYKKVFPNISLKTTDNLNTFILVLIVLLVAIRFKHKC